MKKDPLNNLLLDTFPSLRESYVTYKGGTFDLDTPAHAFYEELFVPYIASLIKEKNENEIQKAFSFIEELMISDDEQQTDIAMKAILTPLYEKYHFDLALLPLKEKSLDYYLTWLIQSR